MLGEDGEDFSEGSQETATGNTDLIIRLKRLGERQKLTISYIITRLGYIGLGR